MPVLERPRHEAFAQAIVAGIAKHDYSQHKAYLAAGYRATPESARRCASRLLTFVDTISKRVVELQEEAARANRVTVESISAELDEAREVARNNDQASAMVAASATKAKLYGLEIKRVEQGNVGDFSQAKTTKDMAKAELVALGVSDPSEDMVAMVIGEMGRHAAALDAIASSHSQKPATA
jgi:hypothetical protein